MPERPEDLVSELRTATQDFDVKAGDRKMGDGVNPYEAELVTERIIAAFRRDPVAFTEKHVLIAAKTLRRRRLFRLLERLVEAYQEVVDERPRTRLLRTLYAQALVDQDQLMAALDVLLPLLDEPPDDDKAAEEARGLVGRVHKQAFVRAGSPLPWHGAEALRLAVSAYADAYFKAKMDRLWPGINLVACLCRATAERVDVPARSFGGAASAIPRDPMPLARQILAESEALLDADAAAAAGRGEEAPDQPWAVATALEAAVALGDDALAVTWGKRYLACELADAFELGSTHRQLTEIWGLQRRSGPAAALVPLLEGQLLRRGGAILQRAAGPRPPVPEALQEAVWGVERFQTREWVERQYRASEPVGQVRDVNGAPVGTAFLVMGRDLKPEWGNEVLCLTNRHVVDAPEAREVLPPDKKAGMRPERARVCFTAREGAKPIPVSELLWRSPITEPDLDTVVLRLASAPGEVAPLEIGSAAGLTAEEGKRSRIFIIGHPMGTPLAYSSYGNELEAVEPPHLYYRSPTEQGSSGSPVFNPDFFLIGIHHSEVPARQANRGTLLDAVRKAIG